MKRVFLDIDDTLNSFTMHALRLKGRDVGDFDYHKFPTQCGYDLQAADRVLGGQEVSLQEFWDSIPREVWANAPCSGEFDLLLSLAEKLVGRDSVCLLTAPTKDPDSLAGKLEWIHANCPPWLHRQYLVGPRKWFCAGPDALLVDDSDANIAAFRKAGGMGLLLPRPWNSNRRFDTVGYVRGFFLGFGD